MAAERSETPLRGVAAAVACPVCQSPIALSGNRRYCSKACRDTAWRRRHQALPAPAAVPPGVPRRPITVYECEACGTRSLGAQRCEDCGSFMRRVGYGGACPHCGDLVAVTDLLAEAPGAH
jgi:endogenous inhibitor of DNA gyrase (YacG/DUF329 family)